MRTFTYKDKPVHLSYSLFGDHKQFFANVAKSGKLDIYATLLHGTKTLVDTVMQNGDNRFGVNAYIEGFNLKKRKNRGFHDDPLKPTTRYHFKITKKQGKEKFEEYLDRIVSLYFFGKKLDINVYTDLFKEEL